LSRVELRSSPKTRRRGIPDTPHSSSSRALRTPARNKPAHHKNAVAWNCLCKTPI